MEHKLQQHRASEEVYKEEKLEPSDEKRKSYKNYVIFILKKLIK